MPYDKERVYDEQIEPLMRQIIEICKREELPFVAQFYLKEQHPEADCEGDPMYCTTVINPQVGGNGDDHIKFIAEAMRYGRNGKPFVMAMTVRTGP